MKTKMKYSATKISPAKMKSSASKALVKSPKLRKSQQKAEEVCQMYFMQLRSGLIIEKTACYFRKEITKRHPPRTGISLVTEYSASLSTYNDQSITFVFEDGSYEIYVEDVGKDQEKDKVLFRYYDSQSPSHETGDGVDGQTLLVNLSPTKDKDFLLHANNKEHSVELQKCENQLPDQAFFRLHRKSSKCVSFECKNNPGVFIGVKDNHLALIKVGDQTEDSSIENTIFKLS
ncbi:interleukin-33 isoform X2 [Eumetopias jubatus]|uniref:interleukin-33 isoform X2 n=1 Tax=Eumetopias jubatus TaxID=34886 RepID=UPI00101697A8|nr:interleukin-33 isoform X2 [Eumetopias jubatus]